MDVVLKWMFFISLIVVLFVIRFDKEIIKILAPGFETKEILLSKEINKILVFALIFYGISNVGGVTLNALYYYFFPALISLFTPLLNIIALFFLVPLMGIKSIALSYLLSNFIKACTILFYLHFKTGWKITKYFFHPKIFTLIRNSSHMTLNNLIWGLRDVITRNFASRIGEGAIALFFYAEKIINVFIQIIINPLAKVFYARISEFVASFKWKDINSLFIRTIRIGVLAGLFTASGVIIFSSSFLNLFFLNSKFTSFDIQRLSLLLTIISLYFLILSFEIFLSRVIFSLKKVWIVTINAFLGVIILFLSLLALFKRYGIYSLSWGIVISQFFVCIFYYHFCRKYLRLENLNLLKHLQRTFIFTLILLGVGIILKNNFLKDFKMIFFIFPLWSILYLIGTKVFLRKEWEIIFG
jgi:peptidoglycan biosynthesis protein MviN/MurJ (putative lipid II flippase)